MFERTLGRQVQEADAVAEPEVYTKHDTTPKEIAADAFAGFLSKLHDNKTDPRRFAVMGYAALWHMKPDQFDGLTQRDLAKALKVPPENFNRAVRRWAVTIGYQSSAMRVRKATRAAIKSSHGSSQSV